MSEYPVDWRDPDVVEEEMESAKETASDLDEDGEHLDAIATMIVFHTLRWVTGEGEDSLDDELLQIKEGDDIGIDDS